MLLNVNYFYSWPNIFRPCDCVYIIDNSVDLESNCNVKTNSEHWDELLKQKTISVNKCPRI